MNRHVSGFLLGSATCMKYLCALMHTHQMFSYGHSSSPQGRSYAALILTSQLAPQRQAAATPSLHKPPGPLPAVRSHCQSVTVPALSLVASSTPVGLHAQAAAAADSLGLRRRPTLLFRSRSHRNMLPSAEPAAASFSLGLHGMGVCGLGGVKVRMGWVGWRGEGQGGERRFQGSNMAAPPKEGKLPASAHPAHSARQATLHATVCQPGLQEATGSIPQGGQRPLDSPQARAGPRAPQAEPRCHQAVSHFKGAHVHRSQQVVLAAGQHQAWGKRGRWQSVERGQCL